MWCVRTFEECANGFARNSNRDKTCEKPIGRKGKNGMASNKNSTSPKLYCARSVKCFLNIRFEIEIIPIKIAIKILHNKNLIPKFSKLISSFF